MKKTLLLLIAATFVISTVGCRDGAMRSYFRGAPSPYRIKQDCAPCNVPAPCSSCAVTPNSDCNECNAALMDSRKVLLPGETIVVPAK